jgi:hypothetical protein
MTESVNWIFPEGEKIGPISSLYPCCFAKATQTALAGSEDRPYVPRTNSTVIYNEKEFAASKLT